MGSAKPASGRELTQPDLSKALQSRQSSRRSPFGWLANIESMSDSELQKLFDAIDTDRGGTLDKDEIRQVQSTIRMLTHASTHMSVHMSTHSGRILRFGQALLKANTPEKDIKSLLDRCCS